MSTQVQFRRGNTAQTSTFTGATAEITVDTDKETIVVHDGSTAGGFPLARESSSNTAGSYANSAFLVANNSVGINLTQNTNITNAGTYANSAFLAANTPSHVANSAASYANSGFAVANSAAAYANSAFLSANNIAGVNLTQNTNITNAGTYANSAFLAANTPSHVANSAASYANSGFTQANSNFTSAVTRLSVTNSGSAAYLIDQYSGNNPSIYVSGGETIAFHLNVITGHPFMIRVSSGGANYNIGLTHVSNTGTILTGSSAQGQVTGTLYWKVPFDIVGSTYVYQCSIHGGMVGNIVIQQPASFVAANTTLAFIAANTPSHIANSAASYANGAFAAANSAGGAASAGSYANSAFATANSSGSYANSAFAAANSATAINTTQNNSITAAFTAANSAGVYANSSFGKANTAAVAANTPSFTANSAASYANSSFARANNSLDANNGGTVTGTITATSFITTGSFGNILGANTIFANNFVANTGFIQFSDGSRQFTANAGSGGGGTDAFARATANAAFLHANAAFNVANTGGGGGANSFGRIVANVGTILATSSNDSIQIVGESGISVSSNVSAKKVIVSVPAGFTFTTADYGFVTDSTNVIFDYGTL